MKCYGCLMNHQLPLYIRYMHCRPTHMDVESSRESWSTVPRDRPPPSSMSFMNTQKGLCRISMATMWFSMCWNMVPPRTRVLLWWNWEEISWPLVSTSLPGRYLFIVLFWFASCMKVCLDKWRGQCDMVQVIISGGFSKVLGNFLVCFLHNKINKIVFWTVFLFSLSPEREGKCFSHPTSPPPLPPPPPWGGSLAFRQSLWVMLGRKLKLGLQE